MIFSRHKNFVRENEIELLNARQHTGFLKQIIIRAGIHTNEIMINFVTCTENPERLKSLVKLLTQKYNNIKSIVNNITTAFSNHSIGEKELYFMGNHLFRR